MLDIVRGMAIRERFFNGQRGKAARANLSFAELQEVSRRQAPDASIDGPLKIPAPSLQEKISDEMLVQTKVQARHQPQHVQCVAKTEAAAGPAIEQWFRTNQ